jgi:hypothetical protein
MSNVSTEIKNGVEKIDVRCFAQILVKSRLDFSIPANVSLLWNGNARVGGCFDWVLQVVRQASCGSVIVTTDPVFG